MRILPLDLADPASASQAVAAAVEHFGSLDTIVHAAGVAPLRPMQKTTDADWHAALAVNLSACFFLARAGWASLARRGGVIVAVSSESARDPFVGFSAYAAAKAGVNGLIRAIAREGRPLGIRAHAVAPGAVETGLLRSIASPSDLPTDQTLDPADVAAVITQCVVGPLVHTSGETIYVHR